MIVIHVIRKPCSEGSVGRNALKLGTGGLNIGGTRLKLESSVNLDAVQRQHTTAAVNFGGAKPGDQVQMYKAEGRWPANLVLQHHPDCKQAGTRQIKAITGTLNGSWRHGHQYEGGFSGAAQEHLGTQIGYGDANGMETVTTWQCADGCPVFWLDSQSGLCPPAGGPKKTDSGEKSIFGIGAPPTQFYRDTGGASRFFKQVGGQTDG